MKMPIKNDDELSLVYKEKENVTKQIQTLCGK